MAVKKLPKYKVFNNKTYTLSGEFTYKSGAQKQVQQGKRYGLSQHILKGLDGSGMVVYGVYYR